MPERGGAAMRLTTGSILARPSLGRHAVDELAQQHAVVLEERGDRLRQRRSRGAVGGLHQVQHEAGGLLAVAAGDIPRGVADQHDVERELQLAHELDRLAHRVAARVPARGHVGPVLGVGVHDRVGDEHELELGALRVALRQLAGLGEGVVEVRPLPVVAVARDVVDEDLALSAEQDQAVAVPLQEAEHLLERRHALGLGVERGQRGGVVHQEQDDGAFARGRRRGDALARLRRTRQ